MQVYSVVQYSKTKRIADQHVRYDNDRDRLGGSDANGVINDETAGRSLGHDDNQW